MWERVDRVTNRTQSNLRTLKSRNQREGWYAHSGARTRTRQFCFSLKHFVVWNKGQHHD